MAGKQPNRVARPVVDEYGRTPLHYAASESKLDEVARLLGSGADVNAQDYNGWSPLHFAAQARSVDCARALIDAGANHCFADSHGNTPLFRAVFSSQGDGAVILLLLKAGANPDAKNKNGVSPRSLAANIGNYDVARFFTQS